MKLFLVKLTFFMKFMALLNLTLFMAFIKFKLSLVFFSWELLNSTPILISIMFSVDSMMITFMVTVSMIASTLMPYSMFYMYDEKFFSKFIILKISFILSMMWFIMSANLLTLILGWDLLGITSFLLVIFYNNSSAIKAGLITIYMNRIGDCALVVTIALMLTSFSWNLLLTFPSNYGTLSQLLLMMAAFTKSAQIPFSAWLPAAMAAPTPISALVHSSTLVTAGVFLLIRYSTLMSSSSNLLILSIGMMTNLMASSMALVDQDFKKIIAYSTLSQLGMMMMLIGMSLPSTAFFHLINHASNKALLFMNTGILIYSNTHHQDSRMFFPLKKLSKVSFFFTAISLMNLSGIPFLSSFYSKDLLIEMMLSHPFSTTPVLYVILMVSFSMLYSIRLLLIICSQKKNSAPHIHSLGFPGVLFCGCFVLWVFCGLMSVPMSYNFMIHSLSFVPMSLSSPKVMYFFVLLMLISIALSSLFSNNKFLEMNTFSTPIYYTWSLNYSSWMTIPTLKPQSIWLNNMETSLNMVFYLPQKYFQQKVTLPLISPSFTWKSITLMFISMLVYKMTM